MPKITQLQEKINSTISFPEKISVIEAYGWWEKIASEISRKKNKGVMYAQFP